MPSRVNDPKTSPHQNTFSVHQRSQSLQFQVCCHGYSKSLLCVTWLNAVDAVKGVWTSASSVCPKKAHEGLLTTTTGGVWGSTSLFNLKLYPVTNFIRRTQSGPNLHNRLPIRIGLDFTQRCGSNVFFYYYYRGISRIKSCPNLSCQYIFIDCTRTHPEGLHRILPSIKLGNIYPHWVVN